MKIYKDELFRENDFYDSDLYHWLLGFIEAYDRVYTINLMPTYKEWLKNGRYDCIRRFLDVTIYEYSLPFGLEFFNQMSVDNFILMQKETRRREALLDEKKALYQEFIEFFN